MDHRFDRVFMGAAATAEVQAEQADPQRKKEREQRDEEEELRKMTAGMTAADAIQRVLLAAKDKDYFRMLELPLPEVDALGRPAWGVTPLEVSKAYRKLSILVHPDKNPGEEARQAFEALNLAHRALKDPGTLEGILRDGLDGAKARRAEAEAAATLDERIALNAAQQEEAKRLQKEEGASFQAEIVRQLREKQEKAKRKRQAAASSRYGRRGAEEESDGSDGGQAPDAAQQQAAAGGSSEDEGAAQLRRQALAKRRGQRKPSGI